MKEFNIDKLICRMNIQYYILKERNKINKNIKYQYTRFF